MSRIGKFTVSAALLLPLVLGGCRPNKGTANPEDYFPLIQVALAGGETGAMIGRNEAIKANHFEGCVAAASLITAFDAANQVLAGRLSDQIVIPEVEIDVSECLALRESAESDEESANAYTFETRVAGYSSAPAEEDSTAPSDSDAAGEAEAEEDSTAPSDSDAAGEDEEPEPEPEEAAEATEEEATPAGLKGNPDAAALVEAIAGITVVAVLHYATKLKGANCKKGTAALGAINYVNGMIKPIADEIAEPDGMVSVPAVIIDLSECNDG